MVYIEVASGVSIDSNHHGHLHQNDIDRMSRELFWEIEQQLIMHKIAKEYYGFRYVRLLDGIFKLESNSRIRISHELYVRFSYTADRFGFNVYHFF